MSSTRSSLYVGVPDLYDTNKFCVACAARQPDDPVALHLASGGQSTVAAAWGPVPCKEAPMSSVWSDSFRLRAQHLQGEESKIDLNLGL
jgi:hypothetical protein